MRQRELPLVSASALFLEPVNRYSATACNDPASLRGHIPAKLIRNAATPRANDSLALQMMRSAIRRRMTGE